MRTLLVLLGSLLTAAGAAALTTADSPAVHQAESLLSASGDTVYDGNTRSAAPLAVRSGDRAIDDESTQPAPGPRVGPGPSDLGEPANPTPKAEEPSSGSGIGGFLSRISWKQVGFAAGGALLGVGLGMLLGWGWLGIAALAVGAAVAGYFLPKLFS